MRRSIAAVALLVSGLLVSGCGSLYDAQLPGGAKVGKNPITVHVMFRDVLDLVPQSTVKVDDVTVGKVTGIKLKGYVADVTLQLPRNVDLPDNATAQIRQTSLLGEKFVSLAKPGTGASGKLSNGDVIPLSRTGRNPEVEEVLGALSLILNGGGVAQLKTIAAELNNAAGGRESDIRSVLDQLHEFVGQVNDNKEQVVAAIEALNRLSGSLRKQDGAIKSALDDLPAAVRSLNGQRADLVKTLQALSRLSAVGTKVIEASKTSTVNTLRDLGPVLDKLADAGQALPDSLQVALTYPFVDDVVGKDPQVARNLHMGDYVNLAINLNINLTSLPAIPQAPLNLPTNVPLTVPSQVANACKQVKQQVQQLVVGQLQALNVLGQFTQTQLATLVTAVLASIDCDHPGNLTTKVPALVNSILAQHLIASLPQLPATVLSSLPTVPLPTAALSSVLGGLTAPLTSGLGLGRVGTGLDGAVTTKKDGSLDVLNGPTGTVASLGYNSTLGSLLLQGVESK
ncbi:MCE family protein [Nocardioides mangrovicus]|uniref:MCE family protein n=1 Tax=Nocardioides mangrovicus TaxID=2478913 RepID=UPI0013149A97|nr:MCE family protein [Nocardioides mangrovicus]